MNLKKWNLFLLLGLLILAACGSDDDDDDVTPQQEQASERFDTTLDDGTRVQGRVCDGEEVLETDGRIRLCRNNQWLVTINDADGFVAELERNDDVISIPEYTFYDIVPQHSIDQELRNVVNDVWVREDMNTNAKDVVRQNSIEIPEVEIPAPAEGTDGTTDPTEETPAA